MRRRLRFFERISRSLCAGKWGAKQEQDVIKPHSSSPMSTPRLRLPTPALEVIRQFPDNGAQWLLETLALLELLLHLLAPDLRARLEPAQAQRVVRTLLPMDLRRRENDALYTVPFRTGVPGTRPDIPALVLVEHKSLPDPATSLQIAQYLLPFWARQAPPFHPGRPERIRLSPPVAFVLYTGREAWVDQRRLEDLFEGPAELVRGGPLGCGLVLFLDLHRFPAQRLEQVGTPVAWALRLLQAEWDGADDYERVFRGLLPGLSPWVADGQAEVWRAVWFAVLHLFHRRSQTEYNRLAPVLVEWARSHFGRRASTMLNTMARAVEERGIHIGEERGIHIGEERGLHLGRDLGRSAEARDTFIYLLETRFGAVSPAVRARIEQADAGWCRARLARLLTATTLDEVLA